MNKNNLWYDECKSKKDRKGDSLSYVNSNLDVKFDILMKL